MALSLESLKLRCSSLLPAWQAVQEQGLNGHCLELHPLTINSNSWQVLIYSHAGLGIRRRQRAAPLNSIVYFALWGRLLKKIAGSSVSMLVFLWGCFNRVALEWKSHPEKWVRHLLILPGLKCIALKLESLKLITPSSCQVQLKSKFLNAFFPPDTDFLFGVNLFNALCKALNWNPSFWRVSQSCRSWLTAGWFSLVWHYFITG